jgi:LysM repeat protein
MGAASWRRAGGVCCALLMSLALAGCGRILQPPAPTTTEVVERPPTETAWPTATRRATFTPVPATPSDTPTPTVTPTPVIYVIKKGDTLLAVARQFGVSVQEVQDVNGIADPRRLQVGQEIIIPAKEGESEPTAVPTPTPVALRIQGLAFYRTPVDGLWCLGEVVNVSNSPAEEVQVQVTLHDAQGKLLAMGAAFTQLDIIASGGRGPFAVLFPTPPDSFSQYQTRVLSGVPSTHLGPRYPDLTIVDDHGEWLDADEGSNYRVVGQVQNAGSADAEQVVTVITLYDEQEHVVASRTVGISAEVFLTGAIAPFDVTLTPLGPVARYDVQVQGWRIGYEIPTATATAQGTTVP